MTTRVAVVLSGCGFQDGSEIHEAVLTLLALDRCGAEVVACAPDVAQSRVFDHLRGMPDPGQARNVLVESARIARGAVKDCAAVAASDVDAVVLPGGFGAALNLCDFALMGVDCTVHHDVARLVREVHAAGKPIAALCIAPVLLARLLGADHPRLTIGTDPGTASALEAMGATHVACSPREVVVDTGQRIVTTPAYMTARRIDEVAEGIERAVEALMEMARNEPVGAGAPSRSSVQRPRKPS